MKKLLPILFIFFAFNIFSQKEANFWYFGNNAALDFNSGTPVPVGGSQLNTTEGCSSFSDVDGNLLFYVGAPTPITNNLTIWNKNNQPMPNGIGLQGDSSSSQSALTVPAPGQPNIYYLFTVGAPSSDNQGFWYYTIDMTANGGLGDVVAGPIDLSEGNSNLWSEKVTAVRANDCGEFWVISFRRPNIFYAYKVNNAGVDRANPVVSTILNYNVNQSGARGYLKVSPDGEKLISANMNDGTFLFSFDDATGRVSNFNNTTFANQINLNGNQGYGVEFSISSRRLYISTGSFNPTTENLFQFDVTQSTLSDINASRFLVHSYFNTRGALQLGPDAKIYWTSNASNNISVINNPEELGVASNYSHQTVRVGSGIVTASQGLPPFISSLLLPIEITDSETNDPINNQDLALCTGTNKTFIPETITGTTPPTYRWFFNNGTTPIATTPNLTLTNLALTDTGTYTLVVELTDNCGNITQYDGTFDVTVFDAATATQPTNIIFCDTDRDGINDFNLQASKDAEILNGLDPTIFEVVYFESMADATANTNPLANPYMNPTMFSSQTIFARVHNTAAPTACFDITNFVLQVTDLPVPQDPTVYDVCDNTSVGTDTDGFVNDFLLSTKDAEILGTLDPTQFNVSYHTTLTGAQTSATTDVIDKTVNYTNIVANSQPIYVRVENTDNTTCFDASKTFDLIVDSLPIINTTVELKQCDDDTDGFSAFNLTEANALLSNDSANEVFVYYPTLADADATTNPITNDTAYTNQTVASERIAVRITNANNCFRTTELLLTVSTTQVPPGYNRDFNACDDFLDVNGNDNANNDDTDGITAFDFSSVKTEVEAFFVSSGQTVTATFYRNEADALAELNAITDIANYRNIGYVNSQDIYVRVDSDIDNDCLGLGPYVHLTVDPVPVANPVGNLELCDDLEDGDSMNGMAISFDLESQTSTILGTQDPANYMVTYHASAMDANTGANPLASPYTNTVRDLQTIYIRVTNNTTNCFTDHTTFDLIVHPVPIANFVPDLEVCDDDADGSARNGFSQVIDLESQTAGILGAQDPAVYSVTYHKSLAEAQAGTNPLASPFSNEVPYRETIYIRVFNNQTMCVNGISNFDVLVNPEPTTATVSNLSYCDDDLDRDDMNGIIQRIDLDSQIEGILGTTSDPSTQQPDDFNVTFHHTQAEASSGANAIASPYTNTNTTETIFVRVENKATMCVNDDASFEVIVNPLPAFKVVSPAIACLNTLPKFINVESASDVYSYEWRNPNGELISTSDTAQVSVINGVVLAGNYTVSATSTDGTLCTRERTVVVNTSNIASITDDDVTIIDQSNTVGNDNLSIQINNINQNLGIGDYQYALEDESGMLIRNYQDEPLFENLEGGIYNILVNDKNGCGTVNLWVSVLEFPKFFTPNFDGRNDTWVIKGANRTFYPESSINIFNRYGKIIAQVALDSQGWDGTYNGVVLPSDDYWFHIQLVPVNTNRNTITKKGHFSLLRK